MPTALIVIDMQIGSFGKEARRYDAPGLIARLNALAARIRAVGGIAPFLRVSYRSSGVELA